VAISTALVGRFPARKPRGWRSLWIEIVLFLVGSGLFVALVFRIGLAPIGEALTSLGLSLGLIIGVEIFAILANTLSWRCTIPPERRGDVPFGRLMAARIVGDAVNHVIPAGAGEIPKIRLLSRYLPVELALASVAMAKLTEGIALGLFGLVGLVVAWPVLAASSVSGVAIAVAVLVGLGLAAACLVGVRFKLLATVVRLYRRLGRVHRDCSPLEGAPSSVDAEIAPFQRGVTGSTVWHLVGWLVNVGELWLACHFLGLRPSFGVVFAGEALGVLLDSVFFLVPMRIGVAEGGRVFVFTLLGLSAAVGLTLGLVRRIRELTWTVIGLAIYPWLAHVDGTAPGRGSDRDRRTPVAA
jgi:lysylphosphatidylglycerol synthase-like protein